MSVCEENFLHRHTFFSIDEETPWLDFRLFQVLHGKLGDEKILVIEKESM